MEDINDNLPTEGKRYYNSHTEYVLTDWYMKSINKRFYEENKGVVLTLKQLVCASNMENARKAIVNILECDKKHLVLKCRIDFLIVGE